MGAAPLSRGGAGDHVDGLVEGGGRWARRPASESDSWADHFPTVRRSSIRSRKSRSDSDPAMPATAGWSREWCRKHGWPGSHDVERAPIPGGGTHREAAWPRRSPASSIEPLNLDEVRRYATLAVEELGAPHTLVRRPPTEYEANRSLNLSSYEDEFADGLQELFRASHGAVFDERGRSQHARPRGSSRRPHSRPPADRCRWP